MGKPMVGLALGAGGAKGFAHVGVLKAFAACDVSVDVLAGTSMGSLVGAFWATGMSPSFMERLACTLRRRHWVDLTVPKVGLVIGDRVQQMVQLLTKGKNIEDADVPFAIVVTDLVERSSVTLTTGSIADAVRASTSIPGIFVPFTKDGHIYVDGGVMERVPVRAARQLGADLVIGVDVAATANMAPPRNIVDVILQSLDMMQERVLIADPPELMLTPELGDIGTSQFGRAKEAIEAGYAAAMSNMDDIQALIQGLASRNA
jgi:NTE family protein